MESKYNMSVYTIDTAEGVEWVAEYDDIKWISGGGNTRVEAIEEAEENLKQYIDYLNETGQPLPEIKSKEKEFSGKFTLRITPTLHKKLTLLAEKEGVSLSALTQEILSERVGQTQTLSFVENKFDEIMLKNSIKSYSLIQTSNKDNFEFEVPKWNMKALKPKYLS